MLLTLVSFFAILGIIVLVHELGHFFAARRGGIKVDEFGLGIPPRIFGFFKNSEGRWQMVGMKAKEASSTIWSLNWIPLGGFVKIKGEEGQNSQDEDSFAHKSVGRRIWVVSAGVTMNIILAVILLTVGLIIGSPQIIDENIPTVARISNQEFRIIEVLADSPAQQAGLAVADTVLSIDGQTFKQIFELQDYVNSRADQSTVLEIKRDEETLNIEVTPRLLAETNDIDLGIGLVQTGLVSFPWYVAPFYGVGETVKMAGAVAVGFYLMLENLIVNQQLIGEVYGPVGIASLVGDAARLGILYLIQLTAALSVIIAVINFLPFPALDGGRVFFLIIEGIRKKPVNQKLEATMHNIGFALLMLLVLIVTYHDIVRISGGFMQWGQKIINLF
ncbi:MAG: RIP metalloprotease RseP [Patescibacteria group bacterium]|jgi:regulator of sigma E protease|nr:RIP metalloprotease RseP [Patescibacteria group bacterium]